MPKKVLLIGMLNSVHFSNWIERLVDSEIEIQIFASRQYRNLNPKLADLIVRSDNIKLISLTRLPLNNYLEYVLDTKWFKWIKPYSRENRLRKIIAKNHFDKIHALEFQHAGYLLTESIKVLNIDLPIIVTNWGSDIYFYQKFPEHVKKIESVLQIAKFYSAECKRDYDLAREYGFKGEFLPVVPNSTTFQRRFFDEDILLPKDRSQIIVKTYGGPFGLGALVLPIIRKLLVESNIYSVFCYSVTPDLESVVKGIQDEFPLRFKYTTVRNPISNVEILQEFKKSKIYIGASRSDGVSTSFLEALATGAYPIQTNTSCANEWISEGAVGHIVNPDQDAIANALNQVLENNDYLLNAQAMNIEIANKQLNYDEVSRVTKSFYD